MQANCTCFIVSSAADKFKSKVSQNGKNGKKSLKSALVAWQCQFKLPKRKFLQKKKEKHKNVMSKSLPNGVEKSANDYIVIEL